MHGPLNPRHYDGDFLLLERDLLREMFAGGKIIGDNHYVKGT